ncbi:hypothetical protein ACEQPO_22305 [Bacillus sp. SL00103]
MEVMSVPYLNKGVAFTKEEREELGLKGFYRLKVLTLEDQAKRAYEQFKAQPDELRKMYLTSLHDETKCFFLQITK